jgi:gliding motility-associated lipoprotein GldH
MLIAVWSCDGNRVFEQNVDIPEGKWHQDSILFFNVNIQDTVSPHAILLNLRHESDYPKQNLFLFINIIAPSGHAIRDTFEIIMADEKGRWFGSGLGDIWDLEIPFKYNVRFPVSGTYRFEFEQAMRYKILPNIRSVGLRVEIIE